MKCSRKITNVSTKETTIDARSLAHCRFWSSAKAGDVFLAVRPEKLKLMTKKPTTSMNSIAGVVGAISYRGDRHHFLVNAEGHDRPISISQQNDSDTKSTPVNVGARVWITWPASNGLVLTH